MEGQIALALIVALPIVLFPAAFIWYLNIGGTVHAILETKKAKATIEIDK